MATRVNFKFIGKIIFGIEININYDILDANPSISASWLDKAFVNCLAYNSHVEQRIHWNPGFKMLPDGHLQLFDGKFSVYLSVCIFHK